MNKDRLLIGEIAEACGVSADTIRHYEQKGVIPPVERDVSGYRRYPQESVRRVRIVRRALSIGFTLDELSRIFRQKASGRPPCRSVRDLAGKKLEDLDKHIAELISVRAALVRTLESWDSHLRSTREGELAHLLDSLIE